MIILTKKFPPSKMIGFRSPSCIDCHKLESKFEGFEIELYLDHIKYVDMFTLISECFRLNFR